MKRWYVVYTLPRKETWAERNLLRQGFHAWLPWMLQRHQAGRRTEVSVVPLFPSYLFVELDISSQLWRSVNGTFGVAYILCNGETPLAAPAGLIESLMARTREAGDAIVPAPQFRPGERLQVVRGPFAELEGRFEKMSGPDRVVVLLSLLGRSVRTTVPLRSLGNV